jgi:hypothetical protein
VSVGIGCTPQWRLDVLEINNDIVYELAICNVTDENVCSVSNT